MYVLNASLYLYYFGKRLSEGGYMAMVAIMLLPLPFYHKNKNNQQGKENG